MAKYLWGTIALLTLACSFLLNTYANQVMALSRQSEVVMRLEYEKKQATEAQEQANIRREKDRSTLVAREADRRSTGLKLAQAEQALQKALEANKTWSGTNVPTEVQEALKGPSDSLPGDAAGLTQRVLNSSADQSN